MSKFIKAINKCGGVIKYKTLAFGPNNGCEQCFYNNELDYTNAENFTLCIECAEDLKELTRDIKNGVIQCQ